MRVCSRHFTQDDYIPSLSQQHYLKKTAVPSVNLPKSSVDSSKKSNHVLSALREQRKIKRSSLKNESTTYNIQQQTLEEPSDFNTANNFQDFVVLDDQIDQRLLVENQTKNYEKFNLQTDQDFGTEEALVYKLKDSNLQTDKDSGTEEMSSVKSNLGMSIKQFKDVATQVKTDNFIPKFSDFISNDSELSTLTGIPNFGLLNTIKKLVNKKKPAMSHSNTKMDMLDIIIMTFMKLKQNMSYALLAFFLSLILQKLVKIKFCK
ncbi:uncharacterized protein LOC141525485 [Cotesia typhae]|uniref:uncharacterized protein LOC141525485 n=1 Tax=Cotesia typhae TaxID=2053667 RepID=UPI003D68F3BC